MTEVTELTDRAVALARDGDLAASLERLWDEDRFLRQAAAAHAIRQRRHDRSYEDAVALFELAEVARRARAFRGPRRCERPEVIGGIWLAWHVVWLGLQGAIHGGWMGAALGSLVGTALVIGLVQLLRRQHRTMVMPQVEDRSPGHVARIATAVLRAAEHPEGTTDDRTDGAISDDRIRDAVLATVRPEQRDDVRTLLSIAAVAHAQRLANTSVVKRGLVPALDDARCRLIEGWERNRGSLPHPSPRRRDDATG